MRWGLHIPHDPICFENCFSNSGPKSLSILQLLNILSLLPHILTYRSHLPVHITSPSSPPALQDPVLKELAIISRSGYKHNDYFYFNISFSWSRSFEGLIWLELWWSHIWDLLKNISFYFGLLVVMQSHSCSSLRKYFIFFLICIFLGYRILNQLYFSAF